jgi:hypothetical protein
MITFHIPPPPEPHTPALVCDVARFDQARFFAAIMAVEGHKWSDPGGALAFTRTTWRKLTRGLPYSYASEPKHAYTAGRAYLAEIAAACARVGLPFDVRVAAGAWNKGSADAIKREQWGYPRDYAQRVANLYGCPLFARGSQGKPESRVMENR